MDNSRERQTQPFDVVVGPWVRFDRYELRDEMIRPAPGAQLEHYDPWQAFRSGRDEAGDTPYQDLANWHRSVAFRPNLQGSMDLLPESEAALLDWCARYGLLGVLPHRALTVDLHPRWDWADDRLVVTTKRYVRLNTWWSGRTLRELGEPRFRAGPNDNAGALLTNYGDRWPQPNVVLQDLWGRSIEEESLGGTWSTFFPDVSDVETYDYPVPLSDEFWKLYAEPLDEFVGAAAALRGALHELSQVNPQGELSTRDRFYVEMGAEGLNGLVSGIRPAVTVGPERGGFRQEWGCLSLLGSLAMMALQDLTQGRRLLQCEVCGRLFTTDAYQARYCSLRCRYRAQKRVYRAGVRRRNAEGGQKE